MNIATKTVDILTSTAGAFSQEFIAPGEFLFHVILSSGGTLSSAADLSITDTRTGMVLLSAANFGGTSRKDYTPRRFVNNAADAVASTSVYDYQALTGSITVSLTGATAANQEGTLYLVCG